MSRSPGPTGPMPGRVLALYALAVMDQEGPVYGYALAERIAERTEGAWRPGPGAIYPALGSLVERGWAHDTRRGVRRVYSASPAGRRALVLIRRRMAGPGPGTPDLSMLWSEIAGASDPGAHLVQRLRRVLTQLGDYVERQPVSASAARALRTEVLGEIENARRRLRSRSARGDS